LFSEINLSKPNFNKAENENSEIEDRRFKARPFDKKIAE